MSYDIHRTHFDEIQGLAKCSVADGLIFCNGTQYYIVKDSDNKLGFFGLIEYKNKVLIKNLYVLKKYRGRGIFKAMMDWILENRKTILEATCTPMSIREFQCRGFSVVRKFKNGCVKVKLENLS